MKIKSGNDVILKILVKDKAGAIITNLATANDIVCQIKTTKDAVTPTIEKKKSVSGEILVDDPSTGYLKVVIKDTDTQGKEDDYYIGVEVQWTDNNQEMDLYEDVGSGNWQLFNEIEITEDIVKPASP